MMEIRQFMCPTAIRKKNGERIELVEGRDYTVENTPLSFRLTFKRKILLKDGDMIEETWITKEVWRG